MTRPRIKHEPLERQQIFFGEIKEALNLVTTLPESYKNRITKVVYSMGSISGNNVRSISQEVHRRIIDQLIEQKQKKAMNKLDSSEFANTDEK